MMIYIACLKKASAHDHAVSCRIHNYHQRPWLPMKWVC